MGVRIYVFVSAGALDGVIVLLTGASLPLDRSSSFFRPMIFWPWDAAHAFSLYSSLLENGFLVRSMSV